MKYAKGISYSSAAVINKQTNKHYLKPFKEGRVYFGLQFYKDENFFW